MGLMLVSCAVAFVIPFELFLFSYAILGPLHYLTEISWLHDHQYYTKGKYDAVVLLVIGFLVTISFFNGINQWEMALPDNFSVYLAFIAFFGSLIFVLVKNPFYRIAGIVLVAVSSLMVLASSASAFLIMFLSVFLPTLVHVYVFTALFMLYGALKSKSRFGLLSVAFLVLCAVMLFVLFPDYQSGVTTYGREAYVGGERQIGFFQLHVTTLYKFFGVPAPQPGTDGMAYWLNAVFSSKAGILLMRFIAFAYTYHYLNWFSKTKVIQWHKVPKGRFVLVIAFWLISIGLYVSNYALGLQWLFFLSYLHVLLEFPLNYTSIIGIGKHIRGRLLRPQPQKA